MITPSLSARIEQLIHEMRTIAMVAGQCSVEGPEDTESLMAAAEAERAQRWADELEALAQGIPPVQGSCDWAIDDWGGDSVYETQCGHVFEFTTDGPAENGIQFCGYCGKSLVEVRTSDLPENQPAPLSLSSQEPTE